MQFGIGLGLDFTAVTGEQPNIITGSSLIAEYKMTEGSGATLNNTGSAAGGDLTISGSPVWSAAGLSFESYPSYALGSFPSTDLDDYSIYCVLKWDVGQAQGAAFAGAFCANYTDGPRTGTQNQANAGRVECGLDNNPVGTAGLIGAGMCSILDGKWHVLCSARVGNTVTTYLDDIIVASEDITGTQTIDTLQWGIDAPGNVYTVPATVGYMALYDEGHSKAQVRSQRIAFAAIMSGRGVSMPPLETVVVLVGDSMMNYAYDQLYQSALIDGIRVINLAVAGSIIEGSSVLYPSMTDQADEIDDYFTISRSHGVIVVLTTNNLASDSAATYLSKLQTWCEARKATAYPPYIAVCTIPPRNDAPFNAKRPDVRTGLYAAVGDWLDEVIPLGEDSVIGPDAAAADASLFFDGVHYTTYAKNIQIPMILGVCRNEHGLTFDYLRPDGTSSYLRPDGVSRYKRN